MNIEAALDEFIADEVPRTLILQGTWGRGKTHLWKSRWQKHCVDKKGRGLSPRRYAYVSLFGLNSISEVKVALGLASLDTESDSASEKPSNRIFKMFSEAAKVSSAVPFEIPYIGLGTQELAQAFAHSRVKNILVCFDDIERRGENLSIRDVLGLVSDLNSQRGCSVVVILNDASLGKDQEEWDANREKVFIRHLTFAPTSKRCVSLVIPEEERDSLMIEIRNALIDLHITNIRIAERVLGFTKEVVAVLAGRQLHRRTQRKIARSLSLLTYCHMAQGEGSPTIEFAFSHGAFSSYFRDRREGISEQEKSWGGIIDNFQNFLDHSIDKALCELVVCGHVKSETISTAISELERDAAAEEAKHSFRGAWDLWRLSFQNNRDQVVQKFLECFPLAASSMSPADADATFQLLRSFGEENHADQLIEVWLKYRVGERSRELNPEYLNDFDRLKDPNFIARASEMFAQSSGRLVAFGDAILKLGLRQGHNQEDIDAIAAATPGEIAHFLVENHGRQLVSGVNATLELSGQQLYETAAKHMRQALLTLAARSSYEADRIKRVYNVVADEGPAIGT